MGLIEEFAAAQSEFTAVPKLKTAKVKTKTGGEYQYNYADFADVLKMALPILSKRGISFSQPLKVKDGKLRLTTRLEGHGEVREDDGIWIPETTSPQEFGSCLTYWRRYGGCSLLGIQPDEDEDAKLAVLASKKAKGEDKFDKRVKDEMRMHEKIKPFQVEAFLNSARTAGKTQLQIDDYLKFCGVTSATDLEKGQFDMCIKWAVKPIEVPADMTEKLTASVHAIRDSKAHNLSRLFASGKSSGWPPDDIRSFGHKKFKVDHLSELTDEQFSELERLVKEPFRTGA